MSEKYAFGFNISSKWISIDLAWDMFTCSNLTIETLEESVEYVQP